MSMILEALTRAEHERQLEKQPDLKFVDPVKPQKNNPKKIWLWVMLGVLANALILFLAVRVIISDDNANTDMTVNDAVLLQEEIVISADVNNSSKMLNTTPIQNDASVVSSSQATPSEQSFEDRPLAMEAKSAQIPEVDRPLIYEAKQEKQVSQTSELANTDSTSISTTKKGKVLFSTTELSTDDAVPVVNQPKLLIDQGESISTQKMSSSSVPKLSDLPESSRNSLNQYEVNVHVFDEDPIRRFVLINMDKYKEGDRIINNGPLVEEITPQGIVVDYGEGRALLPPK